MTAGASPAAARLAATRRRYGEDAVRVVLALFALVSVLTTLGILVALLLPALQFFSDVSPWDFLTGTTWAPLFEPSSFGVLPLLAGTLSVTFWAALVCMPFGLGAAIYLSEYAGPRARNVLKPALEVLAGVPTVVFGYFALTFVTPLLRDLGLDVEIFNSLSAGLVMGVMLIPTVASLSEDAMAAVPRALRYGAYALGSTKLQVATRIVVPAAVSGIVAAFVLGLSRAIGETMTAFIAATGAGDVPTGSLEYKTIFAVGLTLFVLTFAMNVVSIRLVRRFREVYE